MASLSDQIDRLSRNTRAIRATTARATAADPGPFTRAVLSIPLGDLIRDVDPSELGLFSLPESEITRAEFTGATPLKRVPSRRDDVPKHKDIEPEIYAHAALKCIDRYNGVRPMPRAHAQVTAILERLNLVHENIQSLTETLQHAQAVEGPPLKSSIHEEEERVRNLQMRLRTLQERKNTTTLQSVARKSNIIVPPPNSKPRTPPPPSPPQEDSFWNTTAATAKTLRFTDNILDITDSLLDEQVDLGDISAISSSPIPPAWTSLFTPQGDPLQITPSDLNSSSEESIDAQKENVGDVDDREVEEGEDEKTVVVTKPVKEEPITPPSTSPMQNLTPATSPVDTLKVKQPKLRVNSEVERIVTRIWTTVGDMIMPGHPFGTFQGSAGSKPPRAREIIAHLLSLSTMPPSLTSPSVSSVSSISVGTSATPTSQQILTAHLLISLLSSPPEFSLPLNKIKDLLAIKASSGGGAGVTGTTRILYGCVAKRLLKIDRSGGEQVVKFDVQ
ncbi:hypothetical protein C0995_015982 [Termitomyces sp. Mi166|nr:hypothetical protein C0995_015982 [Termitomyces sp. Mi166\